MPTYEFQCNKCGHQFERTRSRDQAGASARCPQCSAGARRLFSAMIQPMAGTAAVDLPDLGDPGDAGEFGASGDADDYDF